MATFLAACMLMGAVPATAFAAKETTEAAETIPQVYRMDDDNDTVRLVIGKTPTLYIGKKRNSLRDTHEHGGQRLDRDGDLDRLRG